MLPLFGKSRNKTRSVSKISTLLIEKKQLKTPNSFILMQIGAIIEKEKIDYVMPPSNRALVIT